MKRMLLLLLVTSGCNLAMASESQYACTPDLKVIALEAPEGTRVPLFVGAPGGPGLRHATNASWQQMNPDGEPLTAVGCFHEGYVQVELPALPPCKEGCWIAVRWVVTNQPIAATQRPCPELVSSAVAASRGPLEPPTEKCLRRSPPE